MTNNYKVIAVNDDESCCDLCGKTNLSKVVWLACEEWGGDSNPRPVGTDCAGKLLNLKAKTPKVIRGVLRDCLIYTQGFVPKDVRA
jgi:hypothetical protein